MATAINWYLPQQGVRTQANLPNPAQVQDGRLYRIPFNFLQIPANGTGQNYIAPGIPFLIWAFTHSIIGGTGVGFQADAFHRHGSFQRDLDQTMALNVNAYGTAQHPAFLKSPYLIDTGEVLGFELRSMEQVNTVDIQIVVWGASLNHIPPGQVPQ